MNFDSGAGEASSQPLIAVVDGQEYKLRAAMPALIVLRGIRARLENTVDEEAGEKALLEVCDTIFLPGELDRLLATGLEFVRLEAILRWAMAAYSGATTDEAEAPGEAPAP